MPRFLRVAAALLALATTLILLLQLEIYPRPSPFVFATRAVIVGAVFQIGLFWAASARGWQLALAVAAMLPSALIFVGLTGQGFMRLVRGYTLNYAATATAVCGVIVYAVAFLWIAREQLTLIRRNAASRT